MSGTPNKRVHDDSGGLPGSYSGVGPTNSKPANPSAPSDHHTASFDTGQDARLPKVPRTEIDSRKSPLLPTYRMQPSSLNDSHSDHYVKPEERDFRDNVNNVRDPKVENRDVKVESKESYQGAKSDKDVRYTSKGDDHKDVKYEKDAYFDYRNETKNDNDVFNPMNSQINRKESKDHHTVDVKGEDRLNERDKKRKDGKHWESGDGNKDRIDGLNNNVNTETKDPTNDRRDKEKDVDVSSSSSSKVTDHDNLLLEQRKPKIITDGENKNERVEKNVDDVKVEKRNKEFDKDSDDGGMDVETDTFNYGVQQRKRMIRPKGSPIVGNRDQRFRSRAQDNDGSTVYKSGECMQELTKLWKEYETSKTSESSKTGPTLEICIPAEHVCATNRQVKGGQLWGTDIYTDDSDLVAVLMHTGYCRPSVSPPPPAIQELRATVVILPPQDCYLSTLRNNVRSRAWGAAIGCSYRVERCYIVKKGGGTIDIEPCLTHTSTVEPTLAPVIVERSITTRASASNALRQQRFVREVTLQYNLCNEPWIKYSISAIADKGLKKPLFTSARLKKGEVLYLESRIRRYELCFNGEKIMKATAHANESGTNGVDRDNNNNNITSNNNNNNDVMDVFRWSECKKPLPQTVMRSIGIPLPPEHLHVYEENLDWEDIQWSQTGVWISGKEYHLSRVHFLSPV